jgi:hypothetical protein
MGYRSDVAYVIKFDDIETRDNFVTLMLAKNDEHITRAIEECEYGYNDDPVITFEAQDVKWYESYDDVKAHHQLMREAVEIYGEEKGGRFRFVGVGEDGAEQFDEDDNENDLYDYITTVHAIETSFPRIPTGDSTLTTTQE